MMARRDLDHRDGPARSLVLLDAAPEPAVREDRTAHRRDLLLLAVFGLVLLGTLLYNFVVATPRYSAEFSYVVRSLESPRERFSILNVASTGGAADNSEAIVAFIGSRDMLALLNADGRITRLFGASGDPFSGFPSWVNGHSREDLYRQYRRYVRADFDQQTNITHVEVEAFSPADAHAVAGRLLTLSERMVNALNQRARASLIASAAREVETARQGLTTTLDRLNRVRDDQRIIEPRLEAGAAIRNASGVAAELARSSVELAQIERVAPSSPALGQLRARRAALRAELARQTYAGAGAPGSLAARTRPYEQLDVERGIAEKRLASASLVLATARANAGRTQLYLERVSQPSLPDEPRYPRAWRNLLITLALTIAVLWIVRSLSELVLDRD